MALPGLPLRGFPDYGAPSYLSASVLTDPAEVYNRLVGFASLDGRGRVLLIDTFGNGLTAWTAGRSGAGAFPVVVTTSPSFISPASVVLDPGVSALDFSAILRLQFLGQTQRIGIEAAFYNVGVNGARFIIQTQYNYSGTIYQARLKYTPSTGVWQIQTPAGDQTIATQTVSNAYAQAKLVADFSTGFYKRVVIGETAIDVSTFAMATTTGITQGTAVYWSYAESIGAGTTPIRLGYVLVTRDEP